MKRVLVWGIGGRLGKMILEGIAKTDDCVAVGGVDAFADPNKFDVPVFKRADDVDIDFDVIIDFSRPEALAEISKIVKAKKVGAVLCTTGYDENEKKAIKELSTYAPIFMSANMSAGINLLINLCKRASAFLGQKFDIEIIEQHHNIKVDSPSGTALAIADAINDEFDNEKEFVYGRHSKTQRREKKEIGIHAVRGGTVVGKHEVLFMGNDEVITISHEAQSKAVFAEGAIKASIFICDKTAGMYDMQDLLEDELNIG